MKVQVVVHYRDYTYSSALDTVTEEGLHEYTALCDRARCGMLSYLELINGDSAYNIPKKVLELSIIELVVSNDE